MFDEVKTYHPRFTDKDIAVFEDIISWLEDDLPERDGQRIGFDMRIWKEVGGIGLYGQYAHNCGTSACICGSIELLHGQTVQQLLGPAM